MRTYELNRFLPPWHSEPATVRQLKVLRFFGIPVDPPPTKGRASGMIGALFSKPRNKHLWSAYVFTTGDEDDWGSDLLPFDVAELDQVVIPADWRPTQSSPRDSGEKQPAKDEVARILADGSPYDDPLPELEVAGTCFAFTGAFEFGTRRQCEEAVVSRGGTVTDGVKARTDVLVIGSDASSSWSHGGYGRKIEAAMLRRIGFGKPAIVPEAYWRELLEP